MRIHPMFVLVRNPKFASHMFPKRNPWWSPSLSGEISMNQHLWWLDSSIPIASTFLSILLFSEVFPRFFHKSGNPYGFSIRLFFSTKNQISLGVFHVFFFPIFSRVFPPVFPFFPWTNSPWTEAATSRAAAPAAALPQRWPRTWRPWRCLRLAEVWLMGWWLLIFFERYIFFLIWMFIYPTAPNTFWDCRTGLVSWGLLTPSKWGCLEH